MKITDPNWFAAQPSAENLNKPKRKGLKDLIGTPIKGIVSGFHTIQPDKKLTFNEIWNDYNRELTGK